MATQTSELGLSNSNSASEAEFCASKKVESLGRGVLATKLVNRCGTQHTLRASPTGNTIFLFFPLFLYFFEIFMLPKKLIFF
jgi:hypothetical protein